MHDYLVNHKICLIVLKINDHKIYIVAGAVQQGKTTFIQNVVAGLRANYIGVAGFLSLGEFTNGMRSGFKLMQISSGKQIKFCKDVPVDGWLKFRKFYFNPDGFCAGHSWIKEGIESETSVLVIDELGPMELDGNGWFSTVSLLHSYAGVSVFVVRRVLVDALLELFQWKNVKIVDVEQYQPQEFVVELLQNKWIDKK